MPWNPPATCSALQAFERTDRFTGGGRAVPWNPDPIPAILFSAASCATVIWLNGAMTASPPAGFFASRSGRTAPKWNGGWPTNCTD